MKKIFSAFIFLLAGCGFSPLYSNVTTDQQDVPVQVAPIPNQYGASMRQVIQGKLGKTDTPLYTLTVSAPSFSSWDQTIDSKNFATTMGIQGSVSYQLRENSTHQVILNHSVFLNSSYSVVKDPYATVVAERKVKKELADQLAEQVSLHVLATLAGINK